MTEASLFLLDLLLLGIGGVVAGIAAIALGGPRRNAPALVALGLYVVVAGIALALTPQLLWERARTDKANPTECPVRRHSTAA